MRKRLALLAVLGAALLWAAAETIRPTSIASQSGYTNCTVGEIDEDPDSDDTQWCDVGGASNTTTNVETEMGNPATAPNGFSNQQEVRVLWRKTNHSTDPTCVVDIVEGGTVRVDNVISAAVSSTTGVVASGNWTFNAASWTDSSGASIAVDVTCTPGGGTPGNRASGEVGAIEVNLTTADAPTVGGREGSLNNPLSY